MKEDNVKYSMSFWYNNTKSRYNRYCKYCQHCGSMQNKQVMCQWFGMTTIEAAKFNCPIPTAGVAMLMENDAVIKAHINAKLNDKKGGTVVPPSNFQFGTTESTDRQKDMSNLTRPHGGAGAHAGKEPLTPSQISAAKCEESDCPYYGQNAAYCKICGQAHQIIHSLNPDMCANLVYGSCDGHACKCEKYIDFDNWNIKKHIEAGRANTLCDCRDYIHFDKETACCEHPDAPDCNNEIYGYK